MCIEIRLNIYFVSPPKCFVNKGFLSVSHLAEEDEMGACFNFYIKLCWPTFTELTHSCIHPTKASNLKRDYRKQWREKSNNENKIVLDHFRRVNWQLLTPHPAWHPIKQAICWHVTINTVEKNQTMEIELCWPTFRVSWQLHVPGSTQHGIEMNERQIFPVWCQITPGLFAPI